MKTVMQSQRLSATKLALERIYIIDAEIASGKYPNTKDLARKCEPASTATISRDIEFMRDRLYAPIEYSPSRRGYHYTQKTYRLPAGFTSAEDLLALGMARSILTLYRDTPLFEAAAKLLDSIIAPLSSDGNRDWLENRIIVPPIASARIDPEIWEKVIAGLKGNHVIAFEYKGVNDKDYRVRKIRPYQLLFDSGVWYLYGWSDERKATRLYSLARIKNAAPEKETFTLPKKFSYTDSTSDSYFGIFIGLKRYRFKIECYGDAEIYASERQWAADQKIMKLDGGIIMDFTSTQYDKVLRWVLSCGRDAIPREPAELVGDWKRHVADMGKAGN